MKKYLFDFDGTLVDSMPVYVGTMLRILDENNIKYGDDIVKIITPLGTIGTAKYFIDLGINKTLEELIDIMKEYFMDEYLYNIGAKKNVIETLKELKNRGYELNILTASPHITVDPCLKRIGIYELFENRWSCDDFNTTKSDPEIYKMAAERLGAEVGEVLFLDDNLNACKTAKEAGMKVCGVYDDSSKEYTEQMKELCDLYIEDFNELLDM